MCLPVCGEVSAITSRRGARSQVPKSPRPNPNPQEGCAERAAPRSPPPCPGAVGVGFRPKCRKATFPPSFPVPLQAGVRGCFSSSPARSRPAVPRSAGLHRAGRSAEGPGLTGGVRRDRATAATEPPPGRRSTASPREAATAEPPSDETLP